MAHVQRFFLYDEGEPTIEDLLRLSPEQINIMASYVDAHGFAGSPEDLQSLASAVGLSYEKAADLVQYAGYLQSERARLKLGVEGLLEEFDIYLERRDLSSEVKPKLVALADSLKRLFADRPQIALREKASSVTAGVIPSGIDFRSICDLRPIFNEDRDTILEYSVVALVRVMLRSETHQESTVVFQVDSQGVTKMEEFLTRLKKKMSALEAVRGGLVGGKK